jgi:3-methyladenine DNA glycosylase AlkD
MRDRQITPGRVAVVTQMTEWVAAELAAVAHPDKAAGMQAYLKTDMPFYGVQTPARTAILRKVVTRFPLDSPEDYVDAVAALWEQPHREEKYLAIGLAAHHRQFVTLDAVPLYERIIVEGAWWDFVDTVASDLIGQVLLDSRPEMSAVLDRWIDDHDLWRRRTAIIAQLKHKEQTDEERLFRYCLARSWEKEFFIRKAIGWALRQYARVAPDAVREFVLAHRDAWSGLTFREATKHLEVD